MIRILHVLTRTARGGLETMLMNYYRNIDRSEIQFDFLKHRSEQESYDEEIKSLGGKIFTLPRMNPWSKTYLKALNDFFSNHPEYKIVHVHQDCMSSVILKAAKNNNVPIRIAHSHSSSQDKNFKYPIKLYYRGQIPKYANRLFACSNHAGKWMFNHHPFTLLNNAIDAKKYVFSEENAHKIRTIYGIDKNSFVVGNVGRFHKVKNQSFLIDIFHEVKKIKENSVLMLIGDGELKNTLENKVKELNISDNVIFTGISSNVNEILSAMDVFVMPSLYEGLPVSLLEAQANGLPCFISDHFSCECDITKTITRISLNSTPNDWAKAICSSSPKPRTNTILEIQSHGFDISENATWLKEYYLQQWKIATTQL